MNLLKTIEKLVNMYEKAQRANFYKEKTEEIQRKKKYYERKED